MAAERRLYVGPSLRRLRRDHGLTQADMAADLEVSPSYIALLERNHRPLSAEMLLRLSQTYKMDMAALAGDGGSDDVARLQAVLKDPMFGDIDLPTLESTDVTTNFPGITEALLVSQRYHLPRAVATCRAVGVDAVGVGDVTVRRSSRYWDGFARRELAANVKMVWDLLTHRSPAVVDGPSDAVGTALRS